MNSETYPSRVPQFSNTIPNEEGYYWWKESGFSSPIGIATNIPEIVKLEIDRGQRLPEGEGTIMKTVLRVGDDRPILSNYDDMGLFSDKIPGIWDVKP